MLKREFIKSVAEAAKVSIDMAEAVVEAMADVTAKALKTEGEIRLPGIATLVAKEYGARPGRNPKTGEIREVPAATRIRIKPSTALERAFAAG